MGVNGIQFSDKPITDNPLINFEEFHPRFQASRMYSILRTLSSSWSIKGSGLRITSCHPVLGTHDTGADTAAKITWWISRITQLSNWKKTNHFTTGWLNWWTKCWKEIRQSQNSSGLIHRDHNCESGLLALGLKNSCVPSVPEQMKDPVFSMRWGETCSYERTNEPGR